MTGQINVNKIAARTGTAITVESGHVITQPGSVIQTVTTGTISSTTFSSTGSWTNTNYTLSITPQFSNSKILFHSNHNFRLVGSTPIRGGIRIQRTISATDTVVWNSANHTETFQVRNADNEHDTLGSVMFLDSPATTSSVTYLLQAYLLTGTNFYVFESARGGGIVLQEIAQ